VLSITTLREGERSVSAPDGQPVTYWLQLLKAGDQESAQRLWEVYFERLVRLVRTRVRRHPVVDDEMLAASAFRSFWQGARAGRFPRLDDRHDLWRILVTIAGQKIADELERNNALKRGAGFKQADDNALESVIGREPTPEMAAIFADEFQRLLEALTSEEYRQIALWKMEGFTNEEIGERLGCSIRTVANRLDVIRRTLIARARK
jgi:RNA polymerase sigma factor (sigma-70 family)